MCVRPCRADDPQKDLLDPAVKGTTTVLRSAAKSKQSVKRVVLTSSIAGAPHACFPVACLTTGTSCGFLS